MQINFGSGMATGKFAIGSNEALGQPYVDIETIDVDAEAPPPQSETAPAATRDIKDKVKSDATSLGKRKRAVVDDSALISGLTDVVWGFATVVMESVHAEAAPAIFEAVMGAPGFTREALMHALCFLTESKNKATALTYVQMTVEDKELWMRTYWGKYYYI
ncbi:hypothetical protein QOZ80_6BG0470750 [Eleusine coracana subsp. coracana]|nr:hypothetical protein QOZ80_6BG0470750 [Eleusine coracana subsp. coracana]